MKTQLTQSEVLDAAVKLTSFLIINDRNPRDSSDKALQVFVEVTKKIKKEYNCE